MAETRSKPHPIAGNKPKYPSLPALAGQGLFLLVESIAFIWLIDRLADADWVRAVCLGQFVLAMAAASVSIYCARVRRRRIYDPLRRLQSLLADIRKGEASIDDLAGIGGGIAALAEQVQEILRELKAQKFLLAEKDHEIRQRIANRTEALERKIGSLRHQATRDSLTGLCNRRALDEHLDDAVERCTSSGKPLSVLMIDVDNFKPLNDTLGHAAGDELLRSIGQLFRSTLRESQTAFRAGGDEFVVVLEGCEKEAAKRLAERLSDLVDGLTRTLKVPAPPRLSVGVASLAELPEASSIALLREADMRLYATKTTRKHSAAPPRDPAARRKVAG